MTIFGIPKEVRDLEMRVGLTPAGVLGLVQAGHEVYVEHNAGISAGFPDQTYQKAGATIVYTPAESYGRADIAIKVARPTAAEYQHFRAGQTLCSFLHLSVASSDLQDILIEKEMTTIAYEMMTDDAGIRPLLHPMSEIAGRLAPLIAGQLLTSTTGGRGTLLGGIPGVPPAAIVILGAGVLGSHAARAFLGLGAQVTILDQNIQHLQRIDRQFDGRVTTMLANDYTLNRVVDFADVVVGAVLSRGQRAPILLTRDMVRQMRSGSVLLDFAIDQGGCAETSRPTTLRDPTYTTEETIHYCVPNATATVARTTSYAITNAVLPHLLTLGDAQDNAYLRSGRINHK